MGKKPRGFGFDPDACQGCPHHITTDENAGLLDRLGEKLSGEKSWGRCGLCGCPTMPGGPMDRFGMPPEDCPRLDLHEGR